MSRFEIFALAWLVAASTLVVGFAFFLGWLDDRALRRKAHRPAE